MNPAPPLLRPILLAEDDPNDLLILKTTLSRVRISNPFVAFRDGVEVVDYLAGKDKFSYSNSFPLPALMLLDIKMPKMSGLEVLAWCRDNLAELNFPIIILSGSVLSPDIEKARSLGAFAYRSKPIDPDGFIRIAEEIRDFWLALPPEKLNPSACADKFMPRD